MSRIVVVGAGVIGLTCATRLAEAGHHVSVVARELPTQTTSVVAAALWYPYRALPQEQVTRWSQISYDVFADLQPDPSWGVRLLPGAEVLAAPQPDPWWAGAVPDLRRGPVGDHPAAWSFTAPVVDMPVYLARLAARLRGMGVFVERRDLESLPADRSVDVVVDCAGLGARRLADDAAVTPVRGQAVVLEQFGLDRWWLDSTDPARPTYVVPRGDTVVVGGTADEGSWDLDPDPDTSAAIIARARRLVPAVTGARVVTTRVGLRPARPAVRLERVGDVVHCYGHGGAGVTVSWGCAADVTALVG